MYRLSFNYIRNYLLVLTFQAGVLWFTVNFFIVPRFHIDTPFSFGELWLYCASFMVLTHNLRMTVLLDTVSYMAQLMQQYTLVDVHLKTLIAEKITGKSVHPMIIEQPQKSGEGIDNH